jgi:Cu-processing system ATP-binding protein
MIDIQHISKAFGKLHVLNDVSIKFQQSECIALIGPNGCGKTTLIKTILGMVVPDSGTVLVNNQSIHQNVSYRSHIGYMPQIGRYPESMTIGQLIEMIQNLRNHNGPLDTDLLEAYQLKRLYDKKMHTLSGGTTQKVSATLAFLFNPEILILDEPTAGLDPLAAEILKEKIIAEKKNGKLILITSHLLSELDELVTRLVFMQDGTIRLHKGIDELKHDTQTATLTKAITHILKSTVHE